MLNTFISSAEQRLQTMLRRWLLWDADLSGYSGSDQDVLSPLRYDLPENRHRRYRVHDGYYHNRIYYNVAQMAALQINRPKLYKYIRGIYNPVRRFCTLYNGKIYGGRLDMEEGRAGAIPIDDADERLLQSIMALWEASHMQKYKALYTHYGALYGTTGWLVVDDPERRQVRLEPLNPYKITDLQLDERRDIISITLEYVRQDSLTGEMYSYALIITRETYSTYKDGKPFALYADASGQKVETWENEYGFVPVALGYHRIREGMFGGTDFEDYLDKFNELNDQQSLLNDQTRKTVNPIWAFAGGGMVKTLQTDEGRDTMDTIQMSAGGSATALAFPLDVQGMIANLKFMQEEMERDLPELTLARLRESGNLTAPGVMAGYSDAIDRIIEAQGNYDAGTIQAQQMAIAIGGFRGYEPYRGYSLDSYYNGDLIHSIAERPVVGDAMSKKERVDTLSANGFHDLMLREMDYDQTTIDKAMTEKNNQTAAAMQGLASAAFGSDEEDEPDPTGAEFETDEEETEDEV